MAQPAKDPAALLSGTCSRSVDNVLPIPGRRFSPEPVPPYGPPHHAQPHPHPFISPHEGFDQEVSGEVLRCGSEPVSYTHLTLPTILLV
eukprot:9379155-Pyramimonas_sp.AAC.1